MPTSGRSDEIHERPEMNNNGPIGSAWGGVRSPSGPELMATISTATGDALRCSGRNDSVEARFTSEKESTEWWSELTPTRFDPVALTWSGLRSSRSTSTEFLRLRPARRASPTGRRRVSWLFDDAIFSLTTAHMKTPNTSDVSRRQFLEQAGPGLAALSTTQLAVAQGSAASSRIRLGLVGCGHRGQWIAGLFAEHGGYEIVGVAEYFGDAVREAAGKFKLSTMQTFTGLKCCEKMIAKGGLDAVAIISPPYFHPEQAQAAVAAGLNVYLAKPVAVDVPGCQSITASGAAAGKQGQVFLVDFQTRTNEFYLESIRRVHAIRRDRLLAGVGRAQHRAVQERRRHRAMGARQRACDAADEGARHVARVFLEGRSLRQGYDEFSRRARRTRCRRLPRLARNRGRQDPARRRTKHPLRPRLPPPHLPENDLSNLSRRLPLTFQIVT
ncbi:MAG: Gfo/Idh/MocA family oxidoreductase [Opitutus sp.]|nr:Gfo/Idh/MocA family oxidoreductase [Opitutus sp.]